MGPEKTHRTYRKFFFFIGNQILILSPLRLPSFINFPRFSQNGPNMMLPAYNPGIPKTKAGQSRGRDNSGLHIETLCDILAL